MTFRIERQVVVAYGAFTAPIGGPDIVRGAAPPLE